MKKVTLLIMLIFSTLAYAQETQHNFDFEQTGAGSFLKWKNFGSADYKIKIDDTDAQSGSTSAVIEYHGDAVNFKALAYEIPANYQGTTIKLTGYIKTENVTDGYAGLWMRIDPSVAFDNMNNRGITGTTDWQQYEISLSLKPQSARKIVVGGMLSGKGKMWVDNLQVTIDGKPLDQVPARPIPPAQKDEEFYKGSEVTIDRSLLNEPHLTDLELLGKVWGFLKYHHPAVGKGDYNWDYELFRVLPGFLNATPGNRQQTLIDWIDKYGEVTACNSCTATPGDAFLKPDLAWIDGSNLGDGLSAKLKHIYNNRHQGDHYYIGLARGVRNPEFKNEEAYNHMPYPDDGFRLLALYKYWNMIHYFFPNRHLTDKNWNGVLKAYLPDFIQAKDELEYEIAALRVIGDIQDTHANLWGGNNAIQQWKGTNYPPVHVRFFEDQLVVADFYNEEHKETMGLALGDVITHIGGNPVADIVKEKLPYYPASNYPTKLRDISGDILRSNDSTVQISIKREAAVKEITLPLFDRKDLKYYNWYRPERDGKSYKLLNDDIGYVTLKNIKAEDIPKIKEAFANTRGIVIDIRNYPSTFVPFSLGGFLMSEPTPFVKFSKGNVDNPGEFTYTEVLSIPNQETSYKGKVVVLVNELSQSQAEYTTMAFRAAPNTTVVGSTTAGADGNVSSILLPGGLRTMISGIGVYYPDGTETQRIGIVPDIEVLPTIAGIRAGRDEVLEKAIEVINSQQLDKTKR